MEPLIYHSVTVSGTFSDGPLSPSVPVSPPVLTIRRPRSQAVEGDVVELHCEAQRGSPPILYRFYHEDVPLGSSSAPSGGEASLNLSLTAEHSGNYSCKANNSLGVQRSKMVSLSITGKQNMLSAVTAKNRLCLLTNREAPLGFWLGWRPSKLPTSASA